MSKELTSLEALQNIRTLFIGSSIDLSHQLNVIETALNENKERIEELEETNHSMFIREHKNTKKLKALEIIKEKKVDVYILLKVKTLDEYNNWYVGVQDDFIPLTQKEYDLLKEALL